MTKHLEPDRLIERDRPVVFVSGEMLTAGIDVWYRYRARILAGDLAMEGPFIVKLFQAMEAARQEEADCKNPELN